MIFLRSFQMCLPSWILQGLCPSFGFLSISLAKAAETGLAWNRPTTETGTRNLRKYFLSRKKRKEVLGLSDLLFSTETQVPSDTAIGHSLESASPVALFACVLRLYVFLLLRSLLHSEQNREQLQRRTTHLHHFTFMYEVHDLSGLSRLWKKTSFERAQQEHQLHTFYMLERHGRRLHKPTRVASSLRFT